MEAVYFSEMLATTYKTTWCDNPEDYTELSSSFFCPWCLTALGGIYKLLPSSSVDSKPPHLC
jgi:hypothetical protein